MKRIKINKDAETDCFSMRRFYTYLTKAGVTSSIKRGYNKRLRKAAKAEARRMAEA